MLFKFKSLSSKLIASFVLVSLVPILIIEGWTLAEAARKVESQAKKLLNTAVNEQYLTIVKRLAHLTDQVDLLTRHHSLHGGTNAQILTALDQMKSSVSGAETVFITDRAGVTTLNTSRSRFDVSDRGYIQAALNGNTTSQIVVSKDSGKVALATAAPLRNTHGHVFGVAGVVVDLASDASFTFHPIGSTGEIYIVGPEGYLLTASRFIEDAAMRQQASEQVMKMYKGGILDTFFGRYMDYRGVEVYGSLMMVPATDWVVVAEIDVSELYAGVYTTAKGLLVLGGVALALAIAVSWLVAYRIAVRIKPVADGAKAVARGDLSFTFKPLGDNDELGELSRGFAQMLHDLRELIGRVQESSLSLAERAGVISGKISEVAAGNDSQASITQEITRTLEQLAAATQQIAANAQHAASASEDTRVAAANGAERVKKSIASLQSVKESVSGLAAVSLQIGGIVSTIEEIAGQTNLLALNAAIEAARAGEHGRGFAVVADAVRGLAERSRQSTKEIARLIASIQLQIEGAVTVSSEGAQGALLAQEALENIVSHVNNITLMVEEISAAGEQQAASANEVAASMENLGAITEEVAASSQETAEAGTTLSDLSKALENVAKRFRL